MDKKPKSKPRYISPKASKDKMAMIIAESDMYGIQPTIKKWGITRTSLYRYIQRSRQDEEVYNLVTLYKKLLASSWAEDAVKAIRQAFFEQCNRMPQLATKEDSECFNAITNFLKVAAELKLSSDALSDGNEPLFTPRPARAIARGRESEFI